ncbi:nad binding of 6-phosphogluconate dehydrogenase domain-containing [Fusarium sporotrichioides]|uniref:Nad binding of 6-phosphogluconate dehydrogenase domain-containing n=1 Tax=Fusarium sporotrichioides TaxID=5514 RepID=A0A395RT28_FUSSP|nr:nad binding of 6-phosphogluconate dehydrogenase domain-containing [Fusarium sporotrichioides]
MVNLTLIHDRDFPAGLFHQHVCLHRTRKLSSEISIKDAEDVISTDIKNRDGDVDMTIISVYYSSPMSSSSDESSKTLEGVFQKSQSTGSSFGTTGILHVLPRALRILEYFGLEYAMTASTILDLDPATMRDILLKASARSIVSVEQKEAQQQEYEMPDLIRDLKNIVNISSKIQYPTPLLSTALSTIEEWQDTHPRHYSIGDLGSPSLIHLHNRESHKPQSQRILVVGLGIMGLSIALSLQKSHHVTGCDVDQERLDEAKSASLPVTADVTSCLDRTDCLLFVLEKSEQILDVIGEISSQLESRRKALVIIAHTTMSASSSIEVRDRIFQLNNTISYFEAPISGGPSKAKSGELLIITGGERAVVEDNLSVLQQMSTRIYFAGRIGNASKMKALHQISAAINHTSTFEITCLGLHCGIKSEVSVFTRDYLILC